MSNRDPAIGMTGARFGRVDRRADPAEPAAGQGVDEPESGVDEPESDPPAVGLTGARFARPPRKRRQPRHAVGPTPTGPAQPEPTQAQPEPEPVEDSAPRAEPAASDDLAAWESDEFADRSVRVRPYVLTGGRTRSRLPLPLEALVTSVPSGPSTQYVGAHAAVVQMCRLPQSVAEVAAHLHVPLGVARVLVDDLVGSQAVVVHRPSADAQGPDVALLHRVLTGLRRL